MTDAFDPQRISDARAKLPAGVIIPRHVADDLGAGRRRPSPASRTWPWWPLVFPRPSTATWNGADWALSAPQDEYDAAERRATAMRDGSQAIAATRQAQAAHDQEERDEAANARCDAQADQVKAELRARYLALPGTTQADFETAYPELLADLRRQQLEAHDAEVARSLRRLTRAAF
jgi:hypothetical protein